CAIEEIENIKSKEIEIVVLGFPTNSEQGIPSDEENDDEYQHQDSGLIEVTEDIDNYMATPN
ncbi:Hypothetical protein FKW44_016373, partial [Caligus rogercresseyi]